MDEKLVKILKNKRGYIFDLDGTLADSEKLQWEAHKVVLKKMFNVELDDAHIYSYLGMADIAVMHKIEEDYKIDMAGKDGKGYQKYADARVKTAAKLVLKNAEPFSYIKEVMAQAGLGLRYCLVTAQNPHLVAKMLKKWDFTKYFNETNTFICDKDHNKMFYYDHFFNNVLKNAKPEEVILFEDVNKYLQEGKKRGFATVGIDNNFGNEPIEADVVVKTQDVK